MNIGIAGAGLLGRLAAWTLAHQGHRVSVFDPAPGPRPAHDGHGAAGFTAAGMLCPLAEQETADAEMAAWGWESLPLWEAVCARLQARCDTPLLHRRGSLLVAHGSDLGSAQRVLQRMRPSAEHPGPQALTPAERASMEPALHGGAHGLHTWWLPGEGHIDTVRTLQALHDDAPGVQWHWARPVDEVQPFALGARNARASATRRFDWVLDCRGTGARGDLPVRGVRGEMVWLHAPHVALGRPVRLLHPRHRVYIVPRPAGRILVGASDIESEDRGPVTLRSAVELMAAAHSIVPGLAEARIERLDVNLRPALPDHRPHVHHEPGLLRINGLYRHGWLLAPALLRGALARLPCADPLPTQALT